ncbi:hypothetical protein FBQ97_12630, partial [Acidobacteria bacterium ACD]|nr:hypothetical protein [Acidobacteria bacterium ACD]
MVEELERERAVHRLDPERELGELDGERGRGADGPGPIDPDDAANQNEPVATTATTENDAEPAGGAANEKGGEGESEGSDVPVERSAGTSEEVAPDEPGVQPPEPEQAAEADARAVAPAAMDEANEPAPPPAGDGAAAPEMDLGAVASAQAALIQTRAAEEHLAAVVAIGQREQLLRAT